MRRCPRPPTDGPGSLQRCSRAVLATRRSRRHRPPSLLLPPPPPRPAARAGPRWRRLPPPPRRRPSRRGAEPDCAPRRRPPRPRSGGRGAPLPPVARTSRSRRQTSGSDPTPQSSRPCAGRGCGCHPSQRRLHRAGPRARPRAPAPPGPRDCRRPSRPPATGCDGEAVLACSSDLDHVPHVLGHSGLSAVVQAPGHDRAVTPEGQAVPVPCGDSGGRPGIDGRAVDPCPCVPPADDRSGRGRAQFGPFGDDRRRRGCLRHGQAEHDGDQGARPAAPSRRRATATSHCPYGTRVPMAQDG